MLLDMRIQSSIQYSMSREVQACKFSDVIILVDMAQ